MEITVNQGQFGFVMGGADERARARVDEMEGKGFKWLGIDNVEYDHAGERSRHHGEAHKLEA